MVILAGYLGDIPQVRKISETVKVCNRTLAVNEYNPETKETKTEWHYLTAWNQIASQLLAFDKGHYIYIEGKIFYEEFIDKKGVSCKVAKIKVVRIINNERKKENYRISG